MTDTRLTDAEVLDAAAERAAKVLPPVIAEVIADDLLDESMRRTNDLRRLLWMADEINALPILATQWGLRIDRLDHVRECSEHSAWLAAPDETPMSRVVGPWTPATPTPPETAQAPSKPAQPSPPIAERECCAVDSLSVDDHFTTEDFDPPLTGVVTQVGELRSDGTRRIWFRRPDGEVITVRFPGDYYVTILEQSA